MFWTWNRSFKQITAADINTAGSVGMLILCWEKRNVFIWSLRERKKKKVIGEWKVRENKRKWNTKNGMSVNLLNNNLCFLFLHFYRNLGKIFLIPATVLHIKKFLVYYCQKLRRIMRIFLFFKIKLVFKVILTDYRTDSALIAVGNIFFYTPLLILAISLAIPAHSGRTVSLYQ